MFDLVVSLYVKFLPTLVRSESFMDDMLCFLVQTSFKQQLRLSEMTIFFLSKHHKTSLTGISILNIVNLDENEKDNNSRIFLFELKNKIL